MPSDVRDEPARAGRHRLREIPTAHITDHDVAGIRPADRTARDLGTDDTTVIGAVDMDDTMILSLIHISEPTRPY